MRHAGKWLAVMLFCVLAGSCDLDWKQRAAEAAKAGRARELAGDYQGAVELYRKALALNPYHAAVNCRLADIYNTRLFFQPGANQLALHYYRRYLDLQPGASQPGATKNAVVRNFVRGQCSILREIISGAMEDPAFAVKDLLSAARDHNSLDIFCERLHPRYLASQAVKGGSGAVKKRIHDFWSRRLRKQWRFTRRDLFMTKGGCQATICVRFGKKNRRQLGLLLCAARTWELAADDPDRGK